MSIKGKIFIEAQLRNENKATYCTDEHSRADSGASSGFHLCSLIDHRHLYIITISFYPLTY